MRSLIFLVLLNFFSSIQCNIILPPTKVSNVQAGFIMVQGAEIPAINYKKFALELQDKFNGSLWVALTEFPLNMPEPVLVNNVMSSAFADLKKNGFNFDSNTGFFFCGHSLGGIIVQNYVIGNYKNLPFKLSGLILEGSFIQRSNLDKVSNLPSILTLGGELDGLARITRLAESFYYNYYQDPFNKSKTIVINGMNHYQFSGEGNPPSNVVKNDITPEIDNENARTQITSIIISYINLQLQLSKDTKLISDYVKSTYDLVSPIINALNLEGFVHFNPPCSKKNSANCTQGSKWTQTAQTYVGTIGSQVYVSDTIRSVFAVPEHFPSMKNCSSQSECALNISTYTDNVYNTLDTFDVGLEPIASQEARTKMESRQSVLQAYTHKNFDFNQTDAINLCGQINQQAINWALKAAPANTVKRYLDKGKVLIPGDDIGPLNNGFLWITSPLSFKEKVDDKNRTYIDLGSPTLRTPTDYSISFVAGFHYCKLLTPARAIEWMYVDSVKP